MTTTLLLTIFGSILIYLPFAVAFYDLFVPKMIYEYKVRRAYRRWIAFRNSYHKP